jgi:hypothetical protein
MISIKELHGADACGSCAILSLRSGDLIISPFRGMYRSDDLPRSIDNTRLKPDHRMRSGPDLTKQCDVSLMTIQQALDSLRLEDTVVGVAGRGILVRGLSALRN